MKSKRTGRKAAAALMAVLLCCAMIPAYASSQADSEKLMAETNEEQYYNEEAESNVFVMKSDPAETENETADAENETADAELETAESKSAEEDVLTQAIETQEDDALISEVGQAELYAGQTYVRSEPLVIDGDGVLRDVTLVRAEDYTDGPLIQVKSGVTFQMENVILDGGCEALEKPVTAPLIEMNYDGGTGARCRLGDGCVLKNNHVNGNGGAVSGSGTALLYVDGAEISNCTAENWGGAIYADGYKVVLNAGKIENCSAKCGGAVFVSGSGAYAAVEEGSIESCKASSWGGAIYATHSSDVYVEGGSIESCHAGGTEKDAGTGGGAICLNGIYGQTNLRMSDGKLLNNSTTGVGGGICARKSLVLISNGEISGNSSGYHGGGMILTDGSIASIRNSLAGTDDDPGVVTIADNHSGTTPQDGTQIMGGGGIYVDGRTNAGNGYVYPISKLYMSHALISNNQAAYEGGGIANCPTGSLDLYPLDGAALYGNQLTKSSGSEDLLIIRNGTTTSDGQVWSLDENDSTGYVSSTMLGGGAYHWFDQEKNEIPLQDLYQVREFRGQTNPTDEAKSAAKPLISVYVTGNSADSYGGGLANNGLLSLGKAGDTVPFSAEKIWNDIGYEALRPDKIRINILQNDEEYGFVTVTPDERGNWQVSFDGLPREDEAGEVYRYTVEEVPAQPQRADYGNGITGYYYSDLLVDQTEQNGINVSLVNSYGFKLQLPVQKIVEGDEADPDQIFEFVLEAEAEENQIVPMPEQGKEKISLTAGETKAFGEIAFEQPGIYRYKVTETDQKADGYTYDQTVHIVEVTIKEEENGMMRAPVWTVDQAEEENSVITITNRYEKPTEPETTPTPQETTPQETTPQETTPQESGTESQPAETTGAVSLKSAGGPNTGETSHPVLWGGFCLLTGILFAAEFIRKLKENKFE